MNKKTLKYKKQKTSPHQYYRSIDHRKRIWRIDTPFENDVYMSCFARILTLLGARAVAIEVIADVLHRMVLCWLEPYG